MAKRKTNPKLLLLLLTLGCSGPAFTEESFNEEGGDSPVASGGAGQSPSSGGIGGSQSGGLQGLGAGGSSSGGLESSQAGTSSGGAATMAGRPTMGEGAGTGGAEQVDTGPRVCLANWQNLDCARVCTNSASDCQAVLNCFVQNNSNSIDNCPQFTNLGLSLAQSAESACCSHD